MANQREGITSKMKASFWFDIRNSLSWEVATHWFPYHRSFQNLIDSSFPPQNEHGGKNKGIRWTIFLQSKHIAGEIRWEHSHPLESISYMLQIMDSHKLSFSKENYHNHFPIKAEFLSFKWPIPNPPYSLGLQASSHFTKWSFVTFLPSHKNPFGISLPPYWP